MIIVHNAKTGLWYVVDTRLNLAVSINQTRQDAIDACKRNGWTLEYGKAA